MVFLNRIKFIIFCIFVLSSFGHSSKANKKDQNSSVVSAEKKRIVNPKDKVKKNRKEDNNSSSPKKHDKKDIVDSGKTETVIVKKEVDLNVTRNLKKKNTTTKKRKSKKINYHNSLIKNKFKKSHLVSAQNRYGLSQSFDPVLMMTPIKRYIRSMDTIGVSPAFITQIIFPDNIYIKDAVSSFPCNVFSFSGNLLRFKPNNKNFMSGNISLTLEAEGITTIMTIFVEKFYREECRIDENEYICKKVKFKDKKSGNVTFSYNNVSTFYMYTSPVKISDLEVIALFKSTTGKDLNDIVSDGKVSYVYQGVVYNIEKDDEHGDIHYGYHRYRVYTASDLNVSE